MTNWLLLRPIVQFYDLPLCPALSFSPFLLVLVGRLCLRSAFSTPGFRCRIPLLAPPSTFLTVTRVAGDLPRFSIRFILAHGSLFGLENAAVRSNAIGPGDDSRPPPVYMFQYFGVEDYQPTLIVLDSTHVNAKEKTFQKYSNFR
jgi:hypothetical protein